MLGFLAGIAFANASEWLIHKYMLHGLGRKRSSYWAFHWHEHHRVVRTTFGRDDAYAKPIWQSRAKMKEAAGLVGTCIAVSPLSVVAPGFVLGVWCNSVAYYGIHRKCHLDPVWGRKYTPWHMDHHLGPNQDKNWCVTWPLFDWILGTREPYIGTERERKHAERRAAATTPT